MPGILGREAAGTVISVGPGDVQSLAPGDVVAWMGASAYAEYSCAPASRTIKLPPSLSPHDAAAALLQGLTAVTLIREAHPVQKGDWVLVHAAAGGVGLWLCQLLRVIGARVIGTVGSEAKGTEARENGAEVTVVYTEVGQEGVVKKVKEVTGGEGVRAVFDGVGKETFEGSMEAVARKGSLVSYGNASGVVPPVAIL
jgi:NADPH2:quinone reductase